jgi:hypothetical protein
MDSLLAVVARVHRVGRPGEERIRAARTTHRRQRAASEAATPRLRHDRCRAAASFNLRTRTHRFFSSDGTAGAETLRLVAPHRRPRQRVDQARRDRRDRRVDVQAPDKHRQPAVDGEEGRAGGLDLARAGGKLVVLELVVLLVDVVVERRWSCSVQSCWWSRPRSSWWWFRALPWWWWCCRRPSWSARSWRASSAPTGLTVLAEIPLTPMFKVDKAALRARWRG